VSGGEEQRVKVDIEGGSQLYGEVLMEGDEALVCPKCGSSTERVTYAGFEVNRCTSCKGLWFELMEEEHLRTVAGSEAIDTGDPEVGRRFDKITSIDCPVCHTRMIRMVDSSHPNLHYEACKVCYGVFFDAGEFSEYKESKLRDFFRNLFHRRRSSENPGS
jgi:Zn-finger nucleic acid-binding protein